MPDRDFKKRLLLFDGLLTECSNVCSAGGLITTCMTVKPHEPILELCTEQIIYTTEQHQLHCWANYFSLPPFCLWQILGRYFSSPNRVHMGLCAAVHPQIMYHNSPKPYQIPKETITKPFSPERCPTNRYAHTHTQHTHKMLLLSVVFIVMSDVIVGTGAAQTV